MPAWETDMILSVHMTNHYKISDYEVNGHYKSVMISLCLRMIIRVALQYGVEYIFWHFLNPGYINPNSEFSFDNDSYSVNFINGDGIAMILIRFNPVKTSINIVEVASSRSAAAQKWNRQ